MYYTNKGNHHGFTLIELLVVVTIIGILSAIAIPHYAKYRKVAQDTAAQLAYHSIALAEEAYFTETGTYITHYESLSSRGGLAKDANVYYGALSSYVSQTTGVAGFTFAVRHKADGSTVYMFDSARTVSNVRTSDYTVLSGSVW
jgi:prepilin-type N-terminal cleavage/methylation domain-containing protein